MTVPIDRVDAASQAGPGTPAVPGPLALLARLVLAGLVVLGLVLVEAGAARADTDSDGGATAEQAVPATVVAVDATGETVELRVFGDGIDRSSITVEEAGQPVEATVGSTLDRNVAAEIMFVVDTDVRNQANGLGAGLPGALDSALDDLDGPVRAGVVRAGSEAEILNRLSLNLDRTPDSLRGIGSDRGAAIHDAVALAAAALDDTVGPVRTVVVITGGADTGSTRALAEVEAALVQRGAQLVTVGTTQPSAELARLAERSGGVNLVVAPGADGTIDAATVEAAVSRAVSLAVERVVIDFPSEAGSGDRPGVELTVGEQTLSFSYPAGVLSTSPVQLTPTADVEPQEAGPLGSPVVLYLSVLLAFAAISAALWSLGSMYAGGESSLDKLLARYADNDETLEESEVQEMLVQTALIQRAIDFTESFAERRGFLSRVEEMLERANLPVRAGEAMFFLGLAMFVVFAAVAATVGSPFVAAILAVITAAAGYAGLQMAAKRRLKAFEGQLPDALQLLAGTMRAGYSLPQGLDAVSQEIADPMGHELRRAITEAQLGRELEDALSNIAERLDSPDFAWAVMAIGIQREVGGNLAEVLLTVAETMVQRERLQREVNALTAEGRVSAGILSMLPPGLGAIMYVMNPSYVGVLFSRTIGLVLIGLAVTSAFIGLIWMKKVVTIDA